MVAEGGVVYRRAEERDLEALRGTDGSFTTDTVYEVAAGDGGFALREVPVDPPLVKVFPDDEEDGEDDGDGDAFPGR